MTGREGETFSGFFYGRRGQPDTDVRGSPLGVGGSRGLGSALIEGATIMIWKRELSGAPTAVLWRCIGGARKAGGMHCEGLIPALPVERWGEGTACCLKKMQTLFCVFSVC